MDAQVSARLRHRHPAFPDKLDRLDLELSAELPSLHDHLRLDKTPNLGVHQTGSSSHHAFGCPSQRRSSLEATKLPAWCVTFLRRRRPPAPQHDWTNALRLHGDYPRR